MADNVSVEAGSAGGVPTTGVEEMQPNKGRAVKKVGFIVNDTIASATEQAEKLAHLLHSRGVVVFETHSASPETSVNWTCRRQP